MGKDNTKQGKKQEQNFQLALFQKAEVHNQSVTAFDWELGADIVDGPERPFSAVRQRWLDQHGQSSLRKAGERKEKLNEIGRAIFSSVHNSTNNSATLQPQGLAEQDYSKVELTEEERVFMLRSTLYRLRNASGAILDGERVCMCGKAPISGDYVTLGLNKAKKAEFNNLQKCGSIWVCPVCSYKLMKKRQLEIYNYLKNAREQNYKIWFLTLTVRHSLHMPLFSAVKKLRGAFQFVALERKHSGIFRKSTNGYTTEYISRMEVLKSLKHGWHPHYHIAFISNDPTIEDQLIAFKKHFAKHTNSWDINQKLEQANDLQGLADYVAKWDVAKELTDSLSKHGQGYTGFQALLKWIRTGNPEYKAVFKEYALTMKGTRMQNFSRGIKSLFKSDEELLNEEDYIITPYAKIHKQLIRTINRENKIPELLKDCEDGSYKTLEMYGYRSTQDIWCQSIEEDNLQGYPAETRSFTMPRSTSFE